MMKTGVLWIVQMLPGLIPEFTVADANFPRWPNWNLLNIISKEMEVWAMASIIRYLAIQYIWIVIRVVAVCILPLDPASGWFPPA